MFGDQCHLCREVVQGAGTVVQSLPQTGGTAEWPSLFVCSACDGWLSSLANDGRSARGEAERSLDGAYGVWLHPNLRGLDVAMDVQDAAARHVIASSCEAMGIGLVEITRAAPVLIVEAHRPGRAASAIANDPHPREARVVLASLTSKDDLVVCIGVGATDWLTVPLTPQQLTAALARARRQHLNPRTWDAATCLPQVYLEGNERPVLRFTCTPGTDPFAVAWTLRRFARGYDELGVSQGEIVLVLRATAGDVPGIIARVRHFVGGSATVTAQGLTAEAPRQRFEVAG